MVGWLVGASKGVGWLVSWLVDWLLACLLGWLVVAWLVGWMVQAKGFLVGWFVGWLVGWLDASKGVVGWLIRRYLPVICTFATLYLNVKKGKIERVDMLNILVVKEHPGSFILT